MPLVTVVSLLPLPAEDTHRRVDRVQVSDLHTLTIDVIFVVAIAERQHQFNVFSRHFWCEQTDASAAVKRVTFQTYADAAVDKRNTNAVKAFGDFAAGFALIDRNEGEIEIGEFVDVLGSDVDRMGRTRREIALHRFLTCPEPRFRRSTTACIPSARG